jgi:hypothetical protein
MDLELVVAHTIGVLRQYDVKKSGKLNRVFGNNAEMVKYPRICTLQDFIDVSNEVNNVVEWFARYILRYSCSSACCLFERFIVPELISKGVTELNTKFGIIQLKNLETHDIFIQKATSVHKIIFYNVVEIVEEDCGRGFYGHNVLVCKESGCVVDFSIGQFTGKLDEQHVYQNIENLCKLFSTPVLLHRKSTSTLIDEQIRRDQTTSALHKTPAPLKISRIVVKRMFKGWLCICRGCYGTSLKLKRCSKCKTVYFCGVHCQKRKWREHRSKCVL